MQQRLRDRYPLKADAMARSCRKLANDLREEHAKGMEPIQATGLSGGKASRVSRLIAAENMNSQAERWEHEVKTGELNMIDRLRINEVPGERWTTRKG